MKVAYSKSTHETTVSTTYSHNALLCQPQISMTWHKPSTVGNDPVLFLQAKPYPELIC